MNGVFYEDEQGIQVAEGASEDVEQEPVPEDEDEAARVYIPSYETEGLRDPQEGYGTVTRGALGGCHEVSWEGDQSTSAEVVFD